MTSRRVIIIHSLDHVRAALAAAAAQGVPVTIASAVGAAGYAGPLWFKAAIDLARAEHPAVDATAILDCGDAPGMVLAALRAGLPHVRFAGTDEMRARLAAMGAMIDTETAEELDLRDESDAEAACRAFLDRSPP